MSADKKPPAKVMVSARVLPESRDLIDAWGRLLGLDRTGQVARMLSYAARHMPVRYDPRHDRTPVQELPCETPPTTTTPNPPTGSPPMSGKSRRLG